MAVSVGLLLGGARAALAGQGKKPAIPDGSWQGSTLPGGGGTITRGDLYGAGAGEANFEFIVEDSGVIDGRMATEGSSGSNVPGATATQIFTGSFDLAGTAEEVTFAGVTHISGTVTAGGITNEYESDGPGEGSFLPKSATCSKVTGDLAFRGREIQEASGFASDVTAPYVALRVKGHDADRVLDEFDALAEQIKAFLEEPAPGADPQTLVDQLFALVDEAATLLNSVRKLRACGAIPPGFKKGLADSYFAEVFTEILLKMLGVRDSLSVPQILSVLGVAFEMGVVGPSAPNKAASEEILGQFANELGERVDEALADGDVDTLTAILTAAETLGLNDLAAQADQAIDDFLADQKAGLRSTPAVGDGDVRGLTELPGVDEKVQLTAPSEDGAGEVPTFKWKQVDGAAAYRLAVVNDDGDGFWAYQGPKTSIVLGLMKNRPPEGEAGPIITDGSRWSVVALDADGHVIAASDFRDVAP